MIIEVYGKQGCGLCKSAKKKLSVMLDRWSVDDEQIEMRFMDMEEDEIAAAEADLFDVFEIPTVLVKRNRDDVVARWDGQAPPSNELKDILDAPAATRKAG